MCPSLHRISNPRWAARSDGDHATPCIIMGCLEDGTIRDVLTGGPLPFTEIAFLVHRVGKARHSLEGDCQIPIVLSPAERRPPYPVGVALRPGVGQAS